MFLSNFNQAQRRRLQIQSNKMHVRMVPCDFLILFGMSRRRILKTQRCRFIFESNMISRLKVFEFFKIENKLKVNLNNCSIFKCV